MRFKALSFFAFLLLAVTASAAGPSDAYFCTGEGTKLHYERRTVDDGELKWRHVMTIDSVCDGMVAYNSLFTKPSGAQMYGGPVKMSVRIDSDGDVHMDVAQAVAAVFSNMLGSSKIKSTGAQTVLPSDMKPGDILPDAAGTVSAGPASMRVAVTERKVLKTERITTPAGTYDCIVVQEHKVEKGTLRNRTTTAKTWYAGGIGMVRHDTYDKNMKLETSEVLVRIEK